MEKDLYSPPPSGGLIRLQSRLTDLMTWLGPAWACVCGVVASGGFGGQIQDWLRLALLILLVDGGWGTLWTALANTNWARALRRWRNWHFGEPSAALPYTYAGSPGDQASRWLGQLKAWGRNVLLPTCGPALSAVVVALPVTVVLGTLLGPKLLLLSAAALATMQLGLAWVGGRGAVAPRWDALIAVGMPWLAGHIAFKSLTLPSAALATLFAAAWGNAWRVKSIWGRVLNVGSQSLTAGVLIALHQPLAAGTVLLLLVPQLVLLPWVWHGQTIAWYVRHTRPWLTITMLIAALAL